MRSVSRLVGVFALAAAVLAAVPTARADLNPREQLKQHVRDIVQRVKAAPTAARPDGAASPNRAETSP